MCEGCLEIIFNNRHVVRHAALGIIKNHLNQVSYKLLTDIPMIL